MNGFDASMPSAMTSSFGLMAPAWMRFHALSVASASIIMIATSCAPSSSVTTRPATTMLKTASSSCECFGKATHWPVPCSAGMSATRTPPIGPENGRPASCVDMDAALIASTS